MAEKEYIERDKAIDACFEGWDNNAHDCADNIRSIHAADVRPVARGKWVQDCDYHFRCSVCGDRYVVSNGNPLDVANGWNFCPNCGAEMREES